MPQLGPQETFLSSPADFAIYGGAAGGGKTYALLMEPSRHVHNPAFGAVIFRRTYKQVTLEGGMWDESGNIYPHMGAVSRVGSLDWTFPSGSRISFAHLQHEKDKHQYQGAQIALLCFDQLEQFSRTQVFYMFSRNRSTCGVRPYCRATCNPDPGWLADFLSWWIDQDTGYAIQERSGIIRWMVRVDEAIKWADSREELTASYPDLLPKSVTFIPASAYDNKILLEHNPEYLANLQALDLVDRERLLWGNWLIKPEAGKVFNRTWFGIVHGVPSGGVACRFWDFAATKKELKGDDPDFTASVLMLKVPAGYFILDCTSELLGPAEADRAIKNTALQDRQRFKGIGTKYKVRWEHEPGASGKRDNYHLIKLMAGFDAKGVAPQGDKITRAKALAVQSEVGNVKLLGGAWNEEWLTHMHHQPDWDHDDIMDASSGAFNELAKGGAWGF